MKNRYLASLLLAGLLLGAAGFWGLPRQTPAAKPPSKPPSPADVIEGRLPAPPPVGTRKLDVGIEMAAPMEWPSILRAKDGRLMMLGAGAVSYSSDKGKTWTKPVNLSVPVQYVRRLNSGKLGGPAGEIFYTSDDDGKNWKVGGKIFVSNVPSAAYEGNPLIQTRSGRLVLPVRFTSGPGHEGLYDHAGSFGLLGGRLVQLEGHAHWPEPDISFAYYSDDEGKTWQRSEGGIMAWHKDGYGGMWPCDEPSVIEARNGDLIMYCRTSLGRVYTARSGPVDYVRADGRRILRTPGQRFDNPQPTVLASSYSPCSIRRIPKTGDLLIVWNQVSGDEIRASYRRGRLSSAISKDDGKTWQHYRTIDASVLPPAGRVEPDAEPQMARGLDYVGVVPEDYGAAHYPNLEIVDDTVFLTWYRHVINPRKGDIHGRRLRVLPLTWFYQDEPAPPPSPKLFVRVPAGNGSKWNTFQVSARYHDGRLYCHSGDLAGYLKSPAGRLQRNIYAPLHQVVTCLGWTARYDFSHVKDAKEPRILVTVRHGAK
jgi:hypothetical protein